MSGGIVVLEEPANHADVDALIKLSDEVAAALYPGEFRRPLNSRTLLAPHIAIFIARTNEGEAAGLCALFQKSDGTGELKRMIVDPRFRGRGVGAALVQAVMAAAADRRIPVVQLEVGIRNTEAQALYRRAGFADRGAFGEYRLSPISLFMEKVTAEI